MTAVKTYEFFPGLNFDLCEDCADYGSRELPLPSSDDHEGTCYACEGTAPHLEMDNGRLNKEHRTMTKRPKCARDVRDILLAALENLNEAKHPQEIRELIDQVVFDLEHAHE